METYIRRIFLYEIDIPKLGNLIYAYTKKIVYCLYNILIKL